MGAEAEILELFRVDLADFTAERNKLTKRYRSEGNKELADQITALRKPTKVAWALNQVVIEQPDDVQLVATIASQLRDAQRALLEQGASDDFRGVQRQFRDALTSVQKHVAAKAGEPAGYEAASHIEQAAWNEEALTKLLSGRISSLDDTSGGSGFDLFEGIILAPRPEVSKAEEKEREQHEEERQRLDRAVHLAEQELERAQQRLDEALEKRKAFDQ